MSLGDSATPIGKVRGLGSAHHGGGHWLTERITSIALLLLGAWLVASLLFLPRFDQRSLLEWLHAPSGAIPMALLIIIGFRHALDGMKVFVDDYVHEPGRNFRGQHAASFPRHRRRGVIAFSRLRGSPSEPLHERCLPDRRS